MDLPLMRGLGFGGNKLLALFDTQKSFPLKRSMAALNEEASVAAASACSVSVDKARGEKAASATGSAIA